ncbi:MAG: exodeoxyribonuclease I [Gammaproteobacteria bacterium]|nr:exodeoxyribonuclease I [Gammaproteobacteria bacterium]
MERTYLFYDIETTGLNKAFDQVLQFAAIRTDEALNEIERHHFHVRLNPDVVPSPHAIIIHGLSLEDLNQGLSEAEAITTIHGLMNTPGTISLGYNTLGFDDEFLRFSFYRNLLPPYNHQYANQCGRMDIYPIATLYFLFNNQSIHWPCLNGVPTLKLEHINTANNFVTGPAHDAMVDACATVEIAKRFKAESEIWDYVIGYFDKETDSTRMGKLPVAFNIQQQSFREGILIDGIFGAQQFYQSYVISLGRHNHYKNQTLWLRLDHQNFSDLTNEELKEQTWVINKKPGENGILLPPSERFTRYLTPERLEIISKNRQFLIEHPDLMLELARKHRDYTHPKIPNIDESAALYQNGFLLPHEIQLCTEFRARDFDGKIALLNDFHNPCLQSLAIRYIGRLHPEKLPPQYQRIYGEYLAKVNPQDSEEAMIDYRRQHRLTPRNALLEISAIQSDSELTARQQELLLGLKNYIVNQFNIQSVVPI